MLKIRTYFFLKNIKIEEITLCNKQIEFILNNNFLSMTEISLTQVGHFFLFLNGFWIYFNFMLLKLSFITIINQNQYIHTKYVFLSNYILLNSIYQNSIYLNLHAIS